MASERLTSVSAAKVGSTQLARPTEAGWRAVRQKIESVTDETLGPHGRDRGPWDLSAELAGQDPVVVPTIAGLTYPLAIEAQGRLVNAGAYRKFTLDNGVLTAVALNLAERAAGDVRFSFQNRASGASTALADELVIAAGAAPNQTDRKGTIRFHSSGQTFTPDGGDAVAIPGIAQLVYNARADVRVDADMGAAFMTELDIFGWLINGTLAFGDMSITDNLSLAEYLATLGQGTLVLRMHLTGKTMDAAPATDKNFTFQRIKFDDPDERLQSRADGKAVASFDALTLAADGTELGIADMISVGDAT